MRRISLGILLAGLLAASASAQSPASISRPDCHTTLFGGISCDQSTHPAKPEESKGVGTICRLGSDAFSRLACADAKLAALRTKLERAYQLAKVSAEPNERQALVQQQLGWIHQRNQNCGIETEDKAPLDQLRQATKCLETEINARIDALNTATKHPPSALMSCQSTTIPYDRLICSNPDLAQSDLLLRKAFESSRNAAAASDRERLIANQSDWVSARNEKCGLTGKTPISVDALQKSKSCVEQEIEGRLAVLTGSLNTSSTGDSAAPSIQQVDLEPLPQTDTFGRGRPGTKFPKFHLSTANDAVKGTVQCLQPDRSANNSEANTPPPNGHIKIDIEDNTKVLHLLDSDTWMRILGNIRSAVQTACARAFAAEHESIGSLNGIVEISVTDGLFFAYSGGAKSTWTVQTNLPKEAEETRSALGVTKWVDAAQLSRNPYFYRDMVVGLVLQFDHRIADSEDVFTYRGSPIVVVDAPTGLFHGEPVILAARVQGIKGVIKESGDEVLLPEVIYVGSKNCNRLCTALATLPTLRDGTTTTTEVLK